MESTQTRQQDKQITVAVPEDRVPEFYAFYGRFLAATRGGRRRHRGHGGCGHHHRAQEEQGADAQPGGAAS